VSDSIIQVENLGKKYIIDHQQEANSRPTLLKEAIDDGIKALIARKSRKYERQIDRAKEEFWALKDVSFEVKQGDRIGIIGRNGAGKSTLLKALSRIIEPTKGRISLRGRVASLLEVGTGFHPELTGRENIYLNGAILGMTKAEIRRKFDEIVDFAEVEKFLDTPVKRYSSGMYVRLAFAVAAHLEPEILIVDEVLAVGDIEFQKKCLGRMKNVASEGRTILFVSHQMSAVNHLCSSGLVLNKGQVAFFGKTESAIKHYLDLSVQTQQNESDNLQSFRPTWANALITSIRILDASDREQNSFPLGADITFEMTFTASEENRLKSPVMGVVINHAILGTICGVNTRMTGFYLNRGAYASATLRCTLKNTPFLQGNYTVDIWLGDGSIDIDMLERCLNFQVQEVDIYQTGYPPFANMGAIFLKPEWQVVSERYF
jgi:lipopolysaccharide transport system ATP-binding protein